MSAFSQSGSILHVSRLGPQNQPHHEKIVSQEGLTFDDLLLLPRMVDFARQDVDLSVQLHPRIRLRLPILSSPMDTVTETAMALAMSEAGGIGVIHRNLTVTAQAEMVRLAKASPASPDASVDDLGRPMVAAAVGAGSDLQERVEALLAVEADVLVVDSGHGHSRAIIDAVRLIRSLSPTQPIMAGNVATEDGARALIDAGADILRVGIGPGSICTTRIVTGVGIPQATAVLSCAKAAIGTGVTIIADGGIKQMGDMAKALACGAHAVMIGSLLAGHDEAPGEALTVEGKAFRQYRGMGSVGAMQRGGAERYGQSKQTETSKLIPEGVEGLVPAKGPASSFLNQAAGSLRSACYYVGCRSIPLLHEHAQLMKMSGAGLRESHPHSIAIRSAGANYLSA